MANGVVNLLSSQSKTYPLTFPATAFHSLFPVRHSPQCPTASLSAVNEC